MLKYQIITIANVALFCCSLGLLLLTEWRHRSRRIRITPIANLDRRRSGWSRRLDDLQAYAFRPRRVSR